VAVLAVLLGGSVVALRGNKNKHNTKGKESDPAPCEELKQEYEAKKAEYEQSIKNVTLQELLIQALEKKIDELKGKAEGELKGAIKKTGHKIKDELIKKDKTGTLKEAVAVVEEAKETYDDLKEKYEKAKKWLEALKNLHASIAKELDERETAYNVCMAGGLVSNAVGRGFNIDLPSKSANEKMIFVDVPTYVAAHQLLERYPNKKFILTRATNAEHADVATKKNPYAVFVLKHNPGQTDQERYEAMLQHFEFIKEGKTKSSRGKKLRTLKEVKQFLDDNI